MAAGYSGTPLAKKLGIKESTVLALVNEPPGFRDLLIPMPDAVEFRSNVDSDAKVTVAFFTRLDDLVAVLDQLADAIFPSAALWLAWPKKASKVPTDLTGDVIRGQVLATKLVDVKICAINDVWSGLKVVWRTEHR